MLKELKQYEKACEKLANKFLSELYDGETINGYYWVDDKIGGILAWGDWFVNMNIIADYFRYNMKPEEFFEWYEEQQDINIKNWKAKQ